MKDLKELFRKSKVKKLLAVFAHPDDESFVSGGLFQAAKEVNIKTALVCLTRGERGKNGLKKGDLKQIREEELKRAVKILGIDELSLWNYPDANLKRTKSRWIPKVGKLIEKINPDILVTFDHSGITGHPDHIVSCHEVLNLVKNLKAKPHLFWRVPDEQEKTYFKENKAMQFASSPNFRLDYGLEQSVRKIRAIYAHKSQVQGFGFKLQILEWFLFDHKELYYKADLRKNYKFRFVPTKFNGSGSR